MRNRKVRVIEEGEPDEETMTARILNETSDAHL